MGKIIFVIFICLFDDMQNQCCYELMVELRVQGSVMVDDVNGMVKGIENDRDQNCWGCLSLITHEYIHYYNLCIVMVDFLFGLILID